MADEPEVTKEDIKHEMEASRASLAAKLETLEREVTDKVVGAKDAVNETVANVKDSVKESVDTVKESLHSGVASVKETFDLPLQTQRHPWLMFGGAVAAGFIAGVALNRMAERRGYSGGSVAGWPPLQSGNKRGGFSTGMTASASPAATTPLSHRAAPPSRDQLSAFPDPGPEQPATPTFAQNLMHSFAPELNKLKGLAIGAIMGIVRETVSRRSPENVRPQLNELFDNLTNKLGGEHVDGNVLESFTGHAHGGNGHHRAPDLTRS